MEFEILAAILLMGLVLGMAVTPLLNRTIKAWGEAKEIVKNNAEFKKKQDEIEQMRKNGDFHEWVTIITPTGEKLVCKKTGWCPELKGFIPVNLIIEYFNKIQLEKEYKEYRDSKVVLMAIKLGYTPEQMEKIVEDVFSIKKDFYIERMTRLTEELSKKASDVEQ